MRGTELATLGLLGYTFFGSVRMFQSHRHVIRPMTTAHLAQTMTLLTLTVDELRQEIDKELAQNPALEMTEERRCPMCQRPLPGKGPCPVCSTARSEVEEEPVVFISPRDDFNYHSDNPDSGYDSSETTSSTDDLPTNVLRQISPELAADDRRIAAYILLNLDENGFLAVTLASIAQYFHVTLARVQAVQRIIQHAEPIGVGSVNTQEALLVQLEVLAETQAVPPLAQQMIAEFMEPLSKRHFNEIAHMLGVPIRVVEDTVHFISENLNPFPTRSHWGDHRQPEPVTGLTYHEPDIIITQMNDKPDAPLVVEIVLPISGTLRINPLFKSAIQQATDEKKDEWKSDLERASLFVKCLQQRNHTILRLMKRLVAMQHDFILHGEKHLRPLTRAFFSTELGVHESTISRAVSGKTIQLPNRRIVPLEKFFDRSLNIRTVLRDIISQEPRPLSDAELVHILEKQGFNVARRTVAKYRAMENILPAHLRQGLAKAA